MEQFKFIKYISCKECSKKLVWYPNEFKIEFANQRSRLARCKACPNLAKTLEGLREKTTADTNDA